MRQSIAKASRFITNNLTLSDCRDEPLNPSNWYVYGTIYHDDDDMTGDQIEQWFDELQSALDFMSNELK